MALYKVVFTENLFSDVKIEQEILDRADARIIVASCKTEDEVIELARDADAIVTFSFAPIGDYIMSHINKCKIIVRGGIGVTTIDSPTTSPIACHWEPRAR